MLFSCRPDTDLFADVTDMSLICCANFSSASSSLVTPQLAIEMTIGIGKVFLMDTRGLRSKP